MRRVLLLLAILGACPSASRCAAETPLKAGIIGCDTSHVIAFCRLLNAPDAGTEFQGITIAYAYPGGSDDIESSRSRIDGFVDQLKRQGVEIVDSIGELADKADVIFLESVDGRKHWPQFREAAVGKPVFIDKPLAASLVDALAIRDLAMSTGTPCFSSSGLRYSRQLSEIQTAIPRDQLLGVDVACPCQFEPHHPDLFWYGIHGVESIYTLMGPGCLEASRNESESAALVVGRWKDGRLATLRGVKAGKADYLCTAFGANKIETRRGFSGYEPLLAEICQFLATGKPPVPLDETIEILAFMEAADESLARNGRPVALSEMMDRAQRELVARPPVKRDQ